MHVDALLHDTSAVVQAGLLDTEVVEGLDNSGASQSDQDWLLEDEPDPQPADKDWVTPGKRRGYQRPGAGRALGSGLYVRKSLKDVATVVFCRDVLSVIMRDGCPEGFRRDAVDRINALRKLLHKCSDAKMNDRIFSLAPLGHVGLVAKFGRNGPRDTHGDDHAAAIELSLVETSGSEVVCACSCAEQCLRVTCSFSDDVLGAFNLVSSKCGVQGADLMRAFLSRLGPALSDGDGRLCGDRFCVVRSVGGNWPWALVRKSRANFWTCLSCTEQGLACTHSANARMVVSEKAAEDEAADEVDKEEADESKMTRAEQIKFKFRRSHVPRSAVPSVAAFEHEADLRRHAILGKVFTYPPVDECPSCLSKFMLGGHRGKDNARVEFEDGAADCQLKWWLCASCDLMVMPDGAAHGVVFSSPNTGFTEPFLFNLAYGLVANGSTLSGSAQMRSNLVELAGQTRFPHAATNLRVLKVLRQGLMLYLELVVEGMPSAVLRCKICTLQDGSYKVLCFDGLYVGIRQRHRKDMARIKAPLDIAAGAVAACSLVYDNMVVLALSGALRHAQADSKGKFEALRFKSLGAVKGAVYAIAALHPDALWTAAHVQDSGSASDRSGDDDEGEQPWDPVKGKKMHKSLVNFTRAVLHGKDVAVILARAVMDTSSDIRSKLPAVTLSSLSQLIASATAGAQLNLPRQVPDRRRAAVYDEPALADTGGERGEMSAKKSKITLHRSIPCTVNGALKVVTFVRALCAETVFPWSSQGDWSAVRLVARALEDGAWSEPGLEAALRDPRVVELRLLRGAVACLVPAMVALPIVRHKLRDVLTAVISAAGCYDRTVKPAADDLEPPPTRADVAGGQLGRPITPAEYDDLWLSPPLLASSLRAFYGSTKVSAATDYHRSGIFCPLLPPLRPGLDFHRGGRRSEEDSTCEKDYGCADGWTPGTFGVFCCCSHPKCVAVIMMDGHEGPRMPLDFIVSRLPTLPSTIIYDFACGTHKSAACRVPRVAKTVNACVDLFHFRSSHKTCSSARCPTSYESLRGVNTSSSEQRNAATKRLQSFIRLLNQRNFMTFSAYQQCASNISAMYREACDEVGPSHRLRSIGWPLWYREQTFSG